MYGAQSKGKLLTICFETMMRRKERGREGLLGGLKATKVRGD